MSNVKSNDFTSKPVLLDLFCGAGGATKGYQRAGFYVIGVDLAPQPNYCGDEFHQADALNALQALVRIGTIYGLNVSAVHASPPCQAFSSMSACRPGLADSYPDLVQPVRELLVESTLPWIMENVPGAPMRKDVTLCGHMFGLALYRHRIFESNIALTEPDHPKHVTPGSRAGHWKPGQIISVSGHCAPIAVAREAMGIDWTNRHELAESIPPAYTQYLGIQLMRNLLEGRG